MFANGMPFARRWSHMRGYHSLPASKDAGTDAGAPLHGPGGLLATPGLRRRFKAKQIVGNLYRGDTGRFQAGSGGGASATRATPTLSRATSSGRETLPKVKPLRPVKGRGGGGKAKKPKPTDAERQAKRDQARAQRQQEASAQQAKNMTAVADATGMGDDLSNLDQFSQGKPLRDADINTLVSQGLMERGADGTPRMTGQGHTLVNAARRGDTQGARDAISRGADQAKQHADAEAKKRAAEEKKKLAKAGGGGGGGGGSKKPTADEKRAQQTQERQQRASATAAQVGLPAAALGDLRSASEQGGVSSPALSSLGLVGSDGLATDQGRRALTALERGDVRGYNAALQDAKARMQREQQAAGRRTQVEQRRQRAEAQRQARLNELARAGRRISPSQAAQLVGAGMVNPQGGAVRTKAGNPGDYLVVEDRTKPSTWHLQVKRNGVPDHRLMGAAWAALHGGYRGNTYQGPDKGKAIDKLKALYRAEQMDIPAEKSFIVYKDAKGQHRWVSRSTTAYKDRDQEIIAADALDTDSVRMTTTKQFGPLRYWHVGQPDPFDLAHPWGPGLDIGDCDYSVLIGRTRVESGTFRDARIAEKVAVQADQYELSPGFFHPADAPDADGVYSAIRTFERSIVPRRYGRASNLFTGLAVKESRMELDEMERRFKTAIADLGLDAQTAAALGEQLVATEKAAAAQGIAYKSESAPPPPPEAPPEITIGGVVYTVKAAAPMVEGSPEEEAAESPEEAAAEGDTGDGMDEGDMEALVEAIAQRTAELVMQGVTPIFGDMKLSEFKTLLSGMATKESGVSAELASLKAQQAVLEAKIAQLQGEGPTTILPDEVAAALKSAGPAAPEPPPDPDTQAALTDPTRPYAAIAARTMPQLYKTTPDGSFNGWTPPPAS